MRAFGYGSLMSKPSEINNTPVMETIHVINRVP